MRELDYGFIFGIVIGSLLTFGILGMITTVFAAPYMNGNNTVANVTPIIDLNDESLADSPIRFMGDMPYGEPKFTQEKLDEIFAEYKNFTGDSD